MHEWQCRAARHYLKLSRKELAELAGVSAPTITNIELGKDFVGPSYTKMVRNYFQSVGIQFSTDNGTMSIQVPIKK